MIYKIYFRKKNDSNRPYYLLNYDSEAVGWICLQTNLQIASFFKPTGKHNAHDTNGCKDCPDCRLVIRPLIRSKC